MGPWLKAEVAATMDIAEIIVHSVIRATDKQITASTKTIVIGIIVARGKNIVRMVIEDVYNPERGTWET